MADRLGKSKNLDFPVGIGTASTGITGQPYMLLTSYESKNSIESVGQTSGENASRGKILSSIALYIPSNSLSTRFDANWGGLEGGALRATMGSAVGKMNFGKLTESGYGWDFSEGNISSILFEGIKSAGIGISARVAAAVDKGTGMLSAQGIAVNNHMSLAYKGPGEFRTHDFAFNFFPKHADDSEVIRKILKDLENGMLPRMAGPAIKSGRTLSAPFFLAPRHWTIDFFRGDGEKNKYLHTIKKSVIKSMQVNHDPNSTVSFHTDGSPVQTSLNLSFQEIELPMSGDDAKERNEQIKKEIEMAKSDPFGPHKRGSQSDFRLKDNITLLQEEGFGIPNIYSFNYKWDTETTWIGVMAQELLDTGYSDAVGMDSEGLYWVDYSRLGFPMIGVK